MAQILARRGQITDARKQLQDHLELAPASQHNQAKDMVGDTAAVKAFAKM